MRKWSLVGGWVVVLALSTGLTWQIVNAADAQVSDRPAPLNVAAPSSPSTSPIPGETSTTNDPKSTGSPSTSNQGTAGSSSSSSSTTAASTGSDAWTIKTIPTSGGTVVVTYRAGEVLLQTATPEAGFSAEIDESGPEKVEVDFESDEEKVEVKVEWKDGVLDVEVNGDG